MKLRRVWKRLRKALARRAEPSPAPEEQRRALDDQWCTLLRDCRQDVRKPLVILSTTTKPIGDSHRANRSMRFALELAELGCPTVYVYYRHGRPAFLPAQIRPNLIQMPNDVFHSMASDLAACKVENDRIFLCSIADFHAVHEINLFKHFGWSTVYEVRDDWEEFHAAGVGRWYHHSFERYLCQHAHRVVAVSPTLRRKMILFGARPDATHLIPNGTAQVFIDQARIQRARRRERPYASERPIVGYFGHLTPAWFDWPLLLATAAASRRLSFEIIGYDAPQGLDLPPNIELMGPRAHDEIIERAERWALTIIPFKLSKLARAVDPIKIYEYLALGLKCVCCPMGQLEQYPLSFIYKSEGEFAPALEQALRYVPSPEDWQRVDKLLARASWTHRVQDLLDAVLKPRLEDAASVAVRMR